MDQLTRPIGVIYEHEDWLAPLFASLDAAGIPFERVFADTQVFDPAAAVPGWSLAINKVSPSSYLRGHSASIAYARQIFPFLEEHGVPVVNGSAAFRLETSKALQLLLLHRLGIRAPRAHVANDVAQVAAAAAGLRFPVIVKPNVGGSGALMRRFASPAELGTALGELDGGPDGTFVVQEYLEPADGRIVRVEFLDGEPLYAIGITNTNDDFNLCPADICQVPDFDNCVVDAPGKRPLRIEAVNAPKSVVADVLRIARAGGLDVGGVEYLIAARDGLPYIYDINALSNFVTDAPALVGFDPHARFAEYLGRRAREAMELDRRVST